MPTSPDLIRQVTGLAEMGMHKEALRAFERVLQIDPHNQEARIQRDRVLEILSDAPNGTSPHEPHTR